MNNKDIQTSFAKRCAEVRAGRGMSREALAHRAGLDRTYYADIEAGRRNPTLATLAKIAKAHGMSLTELLEGV